MQLPCISLTILAALALGSGYAATLPTSAPSVFSSDPNPNPNSSPVEELAAQTPSFSDSHVAVPSSSIDFAGKVTYASVQRNSIVKQNVTPFSRPQIYKHVINAAQVNEFVI